MSRWPSVTLSPPPSSVSISRDACSLSEPHNGHVAMYTDALLPMYSDALLILYSDALLRLYSALLYMYSDAVLHCILPNQPVVQWLTKRAQQCILQSEVRGPLGPCVPTPHYTPHYTLHYTPH